MSLSQNVEVMMSKEDFERYMSTELKYFWQLVLTLKRGLAIEPQVEERSGVS